MDSHWFNQTTKMMNGHDSIAVNNIDLTLKLGLPSCAEIYQQSHHIGQYLDFDQITPHQALLEGINHSKMVMNEGMNMCNIGESFNANEISWPPTKFGNQFILSQYGFSPFSGSPNNTYHYPHYNNFSMNPNNINLLGEAPAMNDYTLLDVPSRRVDRDLGIGSLSHWKTRMRRHRGGRFIDPFIRCTNYSCNTNNTPMWRRGPLGPKTLCNACGIKYRKEKEKRKAKEAGRSNSQDSNAPNGLRMG